MAGVDYSIWVGDSGLDWLTPGESLTWQDGAPEPQGKMIWFTVATGIYYSTLNGPYEGAASDSVFDQWVELTHTQFVWTTNQDGAKSGLFAHVTVNCPQGDPGSLTSYVIYRAAQDSTFPLLRGAF